MFTWEIIEQFFFIAVTAAGIIWLGVALGWREDRDAGLPSDILERSHVIAEAYPDSDKVIRRRVKQAEIHDRWHSRRTVALRENLPRLTRIARKSSFLELTWQ